MVEDPVPGVAMALQRGASAKAELVAPASRSASAVAFDLDVVVAGRLPDGQPRLLGPYVQGPPDARFVYLCVGRYAGQADAEWARRMKVPLGGLGWEAIEALPPGARLSGRVAGRDREGEPACASVAILPPGWRA